MNEVQHISTIILIGTIVILILAILSIGGYIFYNAAFVHKYKAKNLTYWFERLQPYLLIIFLTIFLACAVFSTIYYSARFLPYPSAAPANETVALFNVTLIFTGVAFFATQILLFYFAFRYRTMPNRATSYLKSFLKLELAWTIIPAGVFIFLFLWGQILWAKVTGKPDEDALTIEVVGQQFVWKVRYPGMDNSLGKFDFRYINETNDLGIDFRDPHSHDDFVPVQMHVPKNRPVKLLLRSKDVIHSFFIPHFRVKMDALPGMITTTHFTARTSTSEMREKLNDPEFNYEIACAELCGRMHFAMKLILVVDEPEQFDEWSRRQENWLAVHPQYLEK